MEQFVRDNRYPRLETFKNVNVEPVKRFIARYDKVDVAKQNLQNEFTYAYRNVRVNSRRGPSLDTNITEVYQEAKMRTYILAKSWRVLGLGVQRVSAQFRETVEDEETIVEDSVVRDEEELPTHGPPLSRYLFIL